MNFLELFGVMAILSCSNDKNTHQDGCENIHDNNDMYANYDERECDHDE